MRKLSEFKGEEAIKIMGEIFEPAVRIMGDKKLRDKKTTMDIAKYILSEHPKDVLELLTILEGGEYNKNPLQITADIVELLNDEETRDFFASQGLIKSATPSGSATENTKDKVK